VREQNQEAMRLVAVELAAASHRCQESVEQAERGFVEATALLTTVRELQRLSGELASALGAGLRPGASAIVTEAYERHRGVTRGRDRGADHRLQREHRAPRAGREARPGDRRPGFTCSPTAQR
jgi:hypothetical protein